jgi:hypothetical protein
MAPVWVVLGSGVLIGERVGREIAGGLLLCHHWCYRHSRASADDL